MNVPTAASPGEIIDGRYEIKLLVGRGAMADVFAATDQQTGAQVAIKILRNQTLATDPVAAERFEREAAAQQRIQHPNAAGLIGAGLTRGVPYIVMELLHGRSLAHLLHQVNRLPLARAGSYLWQALQGLDATHAAGILHRDLKPGNLMLEPGEKGDRVVLIDFGFAALEGQKSITRQGFVVGSLSYIAPERLGGGKVDARADLYALGIVFYEMLAGRTPWVGDDEQIISGVLSDPPPLLARFIEGVPKTIDAFIARVLAKDPAGRPATAKDMARELAEAWRAAGGT
jgi:serine/threonine-protein kinase